MCSLVPARASLAPGVGPNPQPPRRTAAFVRSTLGVRILRWRASTQRLHRLNTRSATTSINPKSEQTTVGTTDRWTALRDAGRASTNINPRRQQDMVGATSHRTARRTSGRNRVESGRTDRGTGARALTGHLPSLLNRHRTSESQLPKTAAAIRSRDSCPRAMSAVTGTEQRVRFHPYWVATAFSTVSVGNSHASMEGQRPSRRHTARLAASASTHYGISATPGYDWCGIAQSCRVKKARLASCHGTASA